MTTKNTKQPVNTALSTKGWSARNFHAGLRKDGTVQLKSPGPIAPGEMTSITLSIEELRALLEEAKDWSTSWEGDEEIVVGRVGDPIYKYRKVAVRPVIAWVLEKRLEEIEAAEEKKIEEGKK